MSPLAFMDDTNVLLEPSEVNWFLKRMAKIGKPVGIVIGKDKTKILTNTVGISILPLLPAITQRSLAEAISTFTTGEANRGLRILGIPIGCNTFQREYINIFTTKLTTDTTAMCQVLPDPQTVTQIYRECLIARVPFQLTADILSTVDPNDLPDNNLEWSSPLTRAVRATTRNIIGHATNLDEIPEYAMEIACIPESLHGLGFLCPDRTAVLSFLLPLFRTIRYATRGVPLKHTTVSLGPYFDNLFRHWRTSTQPLFKIMRHYAQPLADAMTMPKKFGTMDPLHYLVAWHDLGSFQNRITKAASAHRKKSLIAHPEPFLGCSPTTDFMATPAKTAMATDASIAMDMDPQPPTDWAWQSELTEENIRLDLPSLFSTTCKAHFITAPRSQPHHRLSPHLLRIALARRLRLPVHTY
eukprot:scaffold52878_cov57-Attheya_sp.AAC.1